MAATFVPPSFSDISKSVNDLIGKDYPVGNAKLEVNTNTPNGLKFTVVGTKDNKSGAISSELKIKYSDKPSGLTYTQVLNNSKVIGGTLELQDSLAKGLKLELNGSLLPTAGQKTAKAGVEYKQANIFTRAGLDLFKGPTVSADAVVGTDGFLAGAEAGYDVADAKVTKFSAALGYTCPSYTLSLAGANFFGTITAGYFHRVQPSVEAGARAIWNRSKEDNILMEVGSKYTLDKDAFLKAKFNTGGILGLGYSQKLNSGVKVALGGSFDTTRFDENVHKVGLSLSFEA